MSLSVYLSKLVEVREFTLTKLSIYLICKKKKNVKLSKVFKVSKLSNGFKCEIGHEVNEENENAVYLWCWNTVYIENVEYTVYIVKCRVQSIRCKTYSLQ